MPKLALSDLKLRSLPTPEKGQKDYWDASLPGFGIRISQGGSKTFILNIDNARRTIGRFGILSLAEARGEAKRILAERTLGRVRPQFITFQQARDEFLEEKRLTRRASTHHDLKRLLTLYMPFKGGLAEATHGEVTHRLNKITAPSEKNHAIAAVKNFFTWCVKRRYLTDNPTAGFSLQKRPSRSRILTDDELKSIWDACGSLDLPASFRTIVRLLIVTGQRRGEIAALRSNYISHNQQTICLPSDLVKNHREHTFPTGDLCRSILPAAEGLLFPARGRPNKPFNGWSKTKILLDELCGVTGWVLHDLRRTFRTNLGKLGVAPHIAERLVNHVSARTDMEEVYDLYKYMPEMRAAMGLWEAHLATILKG